MSIAPGAEIENNYILSLVPEQELEFLRPHVEVAQLHMGEIVEEARKPVQFLYFPIDAAISFTGRDESGHTVDVTVTGKDGCSGSCVAQGSETSASTAMIQASGATLRLPASVFKQNVDRLHFLREAGEQRLARWLVAHGHRTGLEAFPFSVDFLAGQVGQRRTELDALLKEFQKQDLVQLEHNKVILKDMAGLTKRACPCVAKSEEATEEYRRSLMQLATSQQPEGIRPG
jgi:signal-transduction protein with cAMP-binding, CBS, and nucleotidyltransferase domain